MKHPSKDLSKNTSIRGKISASEKPSISGETKDSSIPKLIESSMKFPRAIRVRGARQHNLKSINVDIPTGKLVVICGVSGSGKTSFAFDTLYAEGQRRYIETFSPYTRQFLQRLDKPEYDSIENLPASIAVRRSGIPRSNRSTVATTSEIDDYLRILFAQIAVLFCPSCNAKIVRHSPASLAASFASQPVKRAMIGFDLNWTDAGDLAIQLANLQQAGFTRIAVAGKSWNLADDDRSALAASCKVVSSGYVIVDRLSTGVENGRTAESIETAFQWGSDLAVTMIESDGSAIQIAETTSQDELIDNKAYLVQRLSRDLFCHTCQIHFVEPEPRTFGFNSSLGACEECEGIGQVSQIDIQKIVPDQNKTLRQGAIASWTTPAYRHELNELIALAGDCDIPLDLPIGELNEKHWKVIKHGSKRHGFGGLDGFFRWLDEKRYKMHVRVFASRWKSYQTCPSCNGRRLNKLALAYRIAETTIDRLSMMTVDQLLEWLSELNLNETQEKIVRDVKRQLQSRLLFLQQVGVGYLSLQRPLRTLSGGEATRVLLTNSLGSDLVNMLYVLDEPTVGLHPSDTHRLVKTIQSLRDRGNTVLVVEHEPEMIQAADWVIEIGPGAGDQGGSVDFEGTVSQLMQSESLTGPYLNRNSSDISESSKESLLVKGATNKSAIKLIGASGRNLKNINVEFPLNQLCVLAGVSGSGKSTLVLDTLAAALCMSKGVQAVAPLPYEELYGDDHIQECVVIDQEPISLSQRSNPATYVRIFDDIRKLFAATSDAIRMGLKPSSFSFNHDDGRCPRCEGDGVLAIDMHFLADVQTVCPQCNGTRYKHEVLQAKYRDRSIADCLAMSINASHDFYRGQSKIQSKLQPLIDLGLGYLRLGQSAPTLSSGESQRLKLASYLSESSSSKGTLFVMDEPTTGLHFQDVDRLIGSIRKLIAYGHSAIVIEHNEQFLEAADHVIELGPGPADKGGEVVASFNRI